METNVATDLSAMFIENPEFLTWETEFSRTYGWLLHGGDNR